ncbi:ADP-ribosylglycohydrolase family protein [bacterium]|nr:ADP-ribosylglycohydrolase family protein [bacterium]
MKRLIMAATVLASVLLSTSCGDQGTKTIRIDLLRDKIAGGWAGKMIGVAYGAPTEFRARGEIYEQPLEWKTEYAAGSLRQDDLYVQLSFMMTMDKYGIDGPAEKFAESFATAGYRLWHANVQARKNFFDGIMPPASGSPEFNLHADDIDFQIEADYIGFMCPGMPQTAVKIADKIGRIMNYGDGVYGGMFVAALYTGAFFETDIPAIVNRALLAIPVESDYAKCIRDVIALHTHYPDDWRAAWKELEGKWGDVDICGAMDPFNIDAKLNGAYIVMGLLYGGGDFEKTMEVAIRCGQDSDCNPSNAAAVIGVINGYSGIPDSWKKGIEPVADSLFIFTGYSFNSAVENTLKYAQQLIRDNGGSVSASKVKIKIQEPAAPQLEVSFPDVVPDYQVSAFDDRGWTWKGKWETFGDKSARYAGDPGAEVTFTFNGSGVVLRGIWKKDGGKADVFVDGNLHRTIDTYYWWAGEEKGGAFLWHILGLVPGDHSVRLVVKGEKKPESEGTRIYLTGATVFKTAKKTNESYKFSFQ